jgi:hypothetical protein
MRAEQAATHVPAPLLGRSLASSPAPGIGPSSDRMTQFGRGGGAGRMAADERAGRERVG